MKRKSLIILYSIISFILILCMTAYSLVYYYLDKMQYAPIDENEENWQISETIEHDDVSASDLELTDGEELASIEDQMLEIIENFETKSDKSVMNILLLGIDSRKKSSTARTDAMILMSINTETKKIVLTSFLRDMAVMIPGKSSLDRLNAAHAYGGTALTIKTIEENFKIEIDKYVKIDFFTFIDVVDAVGGLRFDITSDKQRGTINGYVSEINRLTGVKESDGWITECGNNMLLNGKQTLGYVRNRRTGNGDFSRTGNQREAIEKLIEKLKGSSVSELLDIVDIILPNVTTDMTKPEIFNLMLSAAEYMNYDIKQCSVPADNSWSYMNLRGMSVIKIDLKKNIEYLNTVINE